MSRFKPDVQMSHPDIEGTIMTTEAAAKVKEKQGWVRSNGGPKKNSGKVPEINEILEPTDMVEWKQGDTAPAENLEE